MAIDNKEHTDEYMEILKILKRRSAFVRITSILLISFLIIAATLVSTMIVNGKDNQKNWISSILSMSSLEKKKLEPGDLIIFRNSTKLALGKNIELLGGEVKDNQGTKTKDAVDEGVLLKSENELEKMIASIEARTRQQQLLQKTYGDLFKDTHGKKSSEEKLADSIASVLLSLSLIIFIGFVMRAVLVFIRYYMQLGTDFENQRLAYVLSKKEGHDFIPTLQNLRDSKINFEKTPSAPQEKIIMALLDALKSNTSALNTSSDKK
ncbi:hypothetical protein L7Q46_001742 [Serratia marcescens]|nr:hypothetical protein [Serratia marcescens]BEM42747.1 hypothetical protein SME13J_13660 [Serratia marcescens]